MFKFLHAADLHLDSPMRGLERYEGAPVEQIRGATRRALGNLVQLAIDENVRFVLIAGDLLDGDWKDYNTALFLSKEMSKLRLAGIRVFIIRGNHDASSQITRRLSMPDNVRFLSVEKPETILLEDLDTAIHGQGFAERAVREDLSAGYPPARKGLFNIGMLHTAATGREGHEPYAPCSVEGLQSKGYHYWALGHVHRREILHGDPWIVFPGNIQGRHVNESGPKGCSLVTVEEGRCASVEHRNLHVVEWALCAVDASEANSPEELLLLTRGLLEEALQAAAGRLLATRIHLCGASAAHAELLQDPEKWVNEIRSAATDLSGGAAWIEQVKLRTLPAQVGLDERLEQNDPMAELLRFIRKLEPNDELQGPLKAEVLALRAKLPREVAEEMNAFNVDSPEVFRQFLDEVKEMLISRLLSAGGAG